MSLRLFTGDWKCANTNDTNTVLYDILQTDTELQ